MTRPLSVVPAADPWRVFAALREALSGDGPAILPQAARLAGVAAVAVPPMVPQRIALVVETSGSTGRPKRVALSADALLASAAASESALGGPGQWMLALPANYIAGVNVLVRSLVAQTVPVMLPPGHFDPREFCELSEAMDADLRFVSLVPAQLSRLIDAFDGVPGSALDGAPGGGVGLLEAVRRFDRILIGGQAAPPHLIERSLELGLNVTRTYGSSETSGGCVYDGVPIGNAAARISSGQIELSGSMLAEGYLEDPAGTDPVSAGQAFTTEAGVRWYRTGDSGELIDGLLRVTGRLDSVIVSGGVKVSLAAVEDIVRGLSGLADAVVVAQKDGRWGEVPVVVATSPTALTPLREAVSAKLGKPAAPASVVVVEAIPQLASGKPDRIALAAMVATLVANRADRI